MSDPIYNYDETSDTLYISFAPGEKATGIELNENILLRINKQEQRAVSLSIFNYSILAQRMEIGHRSLPLTGLAQLSPEGRQLVVRILNRSPIKELLTISTYTPTLTENIPIASLKEPLSFAPA